MIDWKLHLIFGFFLVLIWLNAIYFLKIFEMDLFSVLGLIVLTLFISVFPDIDLKKSKIRELISISIAFIISMTYIYFYQSTWFYGMIYFIFVYLIFKNLPTKHRGVLHSFKFSIIFSSVFIFLVYFTIGFNEKILFWFLVVLSSYCLHLVLDKI